MPRPPASDPKEFNASVRLGGSEKHIVEARMRELGISSVGEYVRRLIQQDGTGMRPKAADTATDNKMKLTRFRTLSHGVIWNGTVSQTLPATDRQFDTFDHRVGSPDAPTMPIC